MNHHIAIIGGGNLGASLTEGLISSGFVMPQQLTVTRRNIQAINHLKEKGITISSDNAGSVAQADYIILAVKPFQVKEIMEEIGHVIDPSR